MMQDKTVRVSLDCADCGNSSVVNGLLHSDNVAGFESGNVDALLLCVCPTCAGTNLRLASKTELESLLDDLLF